MCSIAGWSVASTTSCVNRSKIVLIAAIDNDAERLLDSVVQLGELPSDFDRSRLRNDLIDFIDEYGSQSIDQFDLSGALEPE